MDVALAPQNHLGRIPDELLLEVIKQPCLSDRDLISLARTNCRHYRVAISPAYKAHIKQSHGLAIYWAIKNERQATLERLSENGVDPNMDFSSDGDYLVFEDLRFAMYELRLTKAYMPAAINCDLDVWATPLAWAVIQGRDFIVEYLLDKGAKLELGSWGLCDCCHEVLHCCPSDDLPLPPRLCLEYKHDDDNTFEADGWSPLHYAICSGHVSTAKLLLARGADARDVVGNGRVGSRVPALLVATYVGLNEIVDYLVEHCAVDVNAKTFDDITALHVAHVAGKYDLVLKYLERGADINVSFSDRNGPWTIFAMACAKGTFGPAMTYLEKGADPRFVIKDQYEREPGPDRYTALRLIWQHKMDAHAIAAGRLDSAIKLEQEIITRSNADLPVNEEEEDSEWSTD